MRAVLCSRGPQPPPPDFKASNQGGSFGEGCFGGWGRGWNGAVVAREEAVAVSHGCYLLAYFESPAALYTPCHSH